MFDMSKYRCISVGIVGENKSRDTHTVAVLPIELLSEVQDDIRTDEDIVSTRGVNKDGDVYRLSVSRGMTINAEWVGANNRFTSPDVRRGEQVLLYQSGDADKYYWDTMGRDNSLRRLETIVWMLSAIPNNSDVVLSRENCYVFETSTHDKHITLTTSKANGEKAKYNLQIDTGNGKVTIEDDHGQLIFVDSPAHHIYMKNGDDSFFELNKTIMNGFTKDEINLETTKFKLIAHESITTETKTQNVTTKTYTENSDTYTHNGKAFTYNGDNATYTIGTSTIDGETVTVNALQTNSMPIAFPAMSCAPGATASAGASGGAIEGDFKHTNGMIETPNIKADEGNITTFTATNITWTSASGPLPS